MGRHDEAFVILDEAYSADRESLDVRRVMAQVQISLGRYEDAITSARWVLDRDSDFPFASVALGRALVLTDRANEAERIFESNPNWAGYLGYLYAVTGRRKEAEAVAAAQERFPGRLMLIYAGLRDKDRAMGALEKTAKVNWWRAATWIHRPEMALLRGHPRLEALKKRLGLPN
jgi:predicted Zn-dependent protease